MWPINLRVYHPKKHDLRIAYQFGTFPYLTTQVNWLDDFQQHQIKQMENVLWAPYITVLLNARQTGWLGECFGDWVNVYTCEWVSEWMGVLLSERMNRCASEWVNTCACEWVSEWVSGWVGGWVSERVNERVSQWVSESVSGMEMLWCQLFHWSISRLMHSLVMTACWMNKYR